MNNITLSINFAPLSPRIKAAKRLVSSLVDARDVEIWLLGHPNETNGLNRLLADIENLPDSDMLPQDNDQR